jgi:hypothetical protein
MFFNLSFPLAMQSRRQKNTRRRRASLVRRLEVLERRELLATLLTTFTVTNTGDNGGVDPRPGAGTGTLRQAIVDVNHVSQANAASPDAIAFDIPGSGVHTIPLAASLPALDDLSTVVIDGYTQPGAKPNDLAVGDNAVLLIELDASQATGPVLELRGRVTVRGLVINHLFGGTAIRIDTRSDGSNIIAGNFIGTDASGTRTFAGQSSAGVTVTNDQSEPAALGNTIGGESPADRNVISLGKSFYDPGIDIENATGTVIEGNYIGTDASGTKALGNDDGILLFSASQTRLGGSAAAARNVISGNRLNGVEIAASSAGHNAVEGNLIGTDATGTAPVGNETGVSVFGSTDNLIGGTVPSAGNVIAFNTGDGLVIDGPALHDPIRLNSVFTNQGLGIDLLGRSASGAPSDDGAINDPQDKDTGPNDLQNFPVLAQASSDNRGTTISGLLNSTPNSGFLLDFYESPADGSSQSYVGTAAVLTDANGNATFNVTLPTTVPSGWLLTATATTADTAPYGDTSEFASPISVVGPPPVSVVSTAFHDATAGAAYTASLSAKGGTGGPYSFAITDGALPAGLDLSSDGVLSGTATAAATYSFTVTATDPTGITGSRALSLAVDAAPASRFDVTGFPAQTTAGMAGSVTVTALDPFGNVATEYDGNLHFNSSDPRAALPADGTLARGTGVFSVTFVTAGAQTVTTTDTLNAKITGSQTGIQVGAAATTKLAVSAPASATQGVQFSITVSAEDQFGNLASGYAGIIRFKSSDSHALLPVDSGLNNGTGNFNVTLETPGLQTVTALDAANSAITGTSSGIMVAGVKKMIATHNSGASALDAIRGKTLAKKHAVHKPKFVSRAGELATLAAARRHRPLVSQSQHRLHG